ncbi:MAG: TraR/DksA family transcriptional regulator [Acidobacteriaceae bacterium]|nr:TraR/DksA family transcriptional regulator [Acidobacteriaceae bacterium]MBV9499049.1 TraR/DksA family transcriptional regulator [Acidobacteriaceae bacterium]
MSAINLHTIRLALEAKRKELLSGGSDRNEILIETAADEFDRMQQQLNREVALSNLVRESRLLRDVEAASARLANGTFGTCLQCDEEIPEKRLKAIPWAAHCVACQERIDRQRSTGEVGEAKHAGEIAA